MDGKQAIEIFKSRLEIPDYEKQIPEYYQAMRMAVEALEKQIPKHDKNDCGRCKDCGTNNNFIINKLGNPKGHKVVYCWNCGQAIDWSEKE